MKQYGRESKDMIRLIAFSVLLTLWVCSGPLYAGPFPVPQGAKCDECGMILEQGSRFLAEVATTGGKTLFFCDIGDMLFHFKKERDKIKFVYVRDYATGEWIEGKKALYVLNRGLKTPMSWGVAAFAEDSGARKWGVPVDFDTAFTLIK